MTFRENEFFTELCVTDRIRLVCNDYSCYPSFIWSFGSPRSLSLLQPPQFQSFNPTLNYPQASSTAYIGFTHRLFVPLIFHLPLTVQVLPPHLCAISLLWARGTWRVLRVSLPRKESTGKQPSLHHREDSVRKLGSNPQYPLLPAKLEAHGSHQQNRRLVHTCSSWLLRLTAQMFGMCVCVCMGTNVLCKIWMQMTTVAE